MHESISLFWLLKGMEWNHLPVAGGIYDQHPKFVDDMTFLIGIENKVQAEKQEKDKARSRRAPSSRRR